MTGKGSLPLIAVLVCILFLAACLPKLETPEQTTDGWRTGSLEEAGIDEKILAGLVARIERNKISNIHGILIVRDEKLVLEQYFEGNRFAYDREQFKGELVDFDRNTTHNTMSITKAVTAATVGIAIDQGLLRGENQPVTSFFPERAHLFDEQKREITIEHLLTMSSGLQWNEWDVALTSTENDLIQLFIVEDPVNFILHKPVVYRPGSYWYYSGGDVNLLGVLFERAMGRKIDEFSAEHLFGPLGISVFQWSYLKPEIVYASGELYSRPRDLAKFGYDEESIPAAVRTGWGGQAIILFPTIDMLVVFTGGNYSGPDPVLDLVQEYILPAAGNRSADG